MWKWILGVAALIVGAAALYSLTPRERADDLERAEYTASSGLARASAGMCAWRDPRHDLHALFPGATGYQQDTISIGRRKVDIQRRLGPDYHMDSTALYVYRVERQGTDVGTVAVRRVAGPHGAIEVVAAVDPAGRIAGVRIQRQREPKEIAAAITDPAWLAGFRGMAANSPAAVGKPLPPVAAEAGAAVRTALRDLLVEMDEGAPHHHTD
jgi:hypothetical protein